MANNRKNKRASKAKEISDTKTPKPETGLTPRDPNLVNAPVEGKKSGASETAKEVHPNDDPSSPHYIAPASENASGTEAHFKKASRGEEVGHYQVPQGGIFNVTNLKA